jgi:hypothetical protein
MATPRLTEEDVHEACAELAGRGERPTALTLLQYLGRGQPDHDHQAPEQLERY